MTNLTKNDYIKILKYYDISIPKSNIQIKRKAKTVLSQKLCRCIKKVDPIHEEKSIGICKRSVLHSKNITTGKFSCKKKKSGKFKKYTRKNRR
jgi:hypothetical protein